MKTRHLMAVLACVALASCVTDKEYEPTLQSEQAKLTFSPPVMYNNNVDSRANHYGEIGVHNYESGTRSYPQDENFVIFAKKYDVGKSFNGWNDTETIVDALFNKATAEYNSSLDGWVPKDPIDPNAQYYWPADKKLAYAAYSPADLEQESECTVTYNETGLSITNFKIPAQTEEQYDLLFSKRRVDMTKDQMYSTADKYSGAPIEFQHALSSIHFSLKNEHPTTKVILKKISLYGVYDKGNFIEGITENGGQYVRGTGGNVTPQWTVSNTSVVTESNPYVAFDATAKEQQDNDLYEGLLFPESAQYISYMMANTTQYPNPGVNHVMLVMPQTLPADAKLKIDYIVDNGENTVEAHKVVNLQSAKKWDGENNVITSESLTTWEIGTKYTYRLVYSSEAAKQDKIYFAPSTEGWTDAGVAVIDLAGGTTETPSTPGNP